MTSMFFQQRAPMARTSLHRIGCPGGEEGATSLWNLAAREEVLQRVAAERNFEVTRDLDAADHCISRGVVQLRGAQPRLYVYIIHDTSVCSSSSIHIVQWLKPWSWHACKNTDSRVLPGVVKRSDVQNRRRSFKWQELLIQPPLHREPEQT